MKNINWIGRRTSGGSLNTDVLISVNAGGVQSNGVRRYRLSFRFTDDGAKKISQPSGVIRFGLFEEDDACRVYFAPCGPGEGLKLSKGKNTYVVSSCFDNDSDRFFWGQRTGGYNLFYDREEKLYYVDLNAPVFKANGKKKGGAAS